MSIERDRELDRILRVLDEDAELPVGTEARVWNRVRHGRMHRRNLGLAIAAVVLAVLGVLGALAVGSIGDDDQVDVATESESESDAETETLGPCETFRATGRSPQRLRTMLLAGTLEAGEITRSVEALEELRDDLEAGGRLRSGDQTDRDLDQIAGALRQADASLVSDDRSGALRALDFAITRYEGSELATESCLG